ncbi:OmpA family protein [Thalassovita sp.]|jgi:OOP family OmpA-OmpF porin|uniref:OmpA family protein n=1 Tax=Thalassovita sp. TaxID=1979401 RepID=UPI003B5A5BC8
MLRLAVFLAALAAVPAGASHALTLTLPEASKPLADQQSAADNYVLPTGPFANGALPGERLEGSVTRKSWQIGSESLTSLQLFSPLRDQLQEAGYTVLFECGGAECGGFDFRFETEVLPAPDMHVDLTDFRFLSAKKGSDDHLSLLVSRSNNSGFVQMIRVTPAQEQASLETPTLVQPAALAQAGTPDLLTLEAHGRTILQDLSFETGSAALAEGTFASLQALSGYLLANPDRRIVLVGHTDAVGQLEQNLALSKRRASAVLERLVSAYGVPRAQLEAEGMGYLSPIAPNQTDAGREANRRVEAILLNTD